MKSLFRTLILFCIVPFCYAQENTLSSIDFNGYLSGMPSLYWFRDSNNTQLGDTSAWQILLHNRMNFDWYPGKGFSGSLQFRNQLIGGEFIEAASPGNGFMKESYFLPLTFQQVLGDKYLLSLSVDRAWLMYTYESFEVKVGRQRINWGQTFVWNPNDLFNSYNFFDFDYPERPGADAIRLQYYTGYTSSVDLAAKADSAGRITAGALYRFNKWNTDFQLMAGYFSHANKLILAPGFPALEWEDKDLVGGLGFSGAISSLSIRGEMSYFHSLREDSDSASQFLGSIALDYSFPSQAMLMFEFFYNSNVQLPGTSFLNFYGGTQNVKSLTYTKYNAFGQFSYPINPILNATLAGMYFWDDFLKGAFLGPSLDLSLGDNLALSAYFQFFAFTLNTGNNREWLTSNFAFLRLKWNF